jgi:hypothetical protein
MMSFNPKERNWVIKYESWESYNAETKEEAIEMFKRDGHTESEIIEVE